MKLRVVPVLALTFSLCTSCSNVNKTTEKIVPVMTGQGVYSVNFTSYNELTENLLNSIDAIKKDMDHNKFDNINIKEFEDRIKQDNTIKIPKEDGKELDIRKKEGYFSISLQTKDMYDKPWMYYHFEDGESNSYVKVTDVSREIIKVDAHNTFDFMDKMDPVPDDNKFYPAYDDIYRKNIKMREKNIDVVFGKFANDTRVYASFLYDDSLVVVCCSSEKIESGFLRAFSLDTFDLGSEL
jgi:hypothetical protein